MGWERKGIDENFCNWAEWANNKLLEFDNKIKALEEKE